MLLPSTTSPLTAIPRSLSRGSHVRPRYRIGNDDREASTIGNILKSSDAAEMLRAAHTVLQHAEQRIGDYCSTFAHLPPAAGADAPAATRRCWHVYRSLRQARRHAEAAAGAELVNEGHPGPAVHELEALENLVRELEYSSTGDMCAVLAANQRLLDRLSTSASESVDTATGEAEEAAVAAAKGTARAGAGGGDTAAPGAAAAATPRAGRSTASGKGLDSYVVVVDGLPREQAEAIFRKLDRKQRGWIDREDLMAGLDMLGQHLDLSDVEQICVFLGGAMGAEGDGRIGMQTFCDIVEAQRLMVPGSDGVFLRHLHHDRPEWWTEMPHYINNAP